MKPVVSPRGGLLRFTLCSGGSRRGVVPLATGTYRLPRGFIVHYLPGHSENRLLLRCPRRCCHGLRQAKKESWGSMGKTGIQVSMATWDLHDLRVRLASILARCLTASH
jgi:hypothetical protein